MREGRPQEAVPHGFTGTVATNHIDVGVSVFIFIVLTVLSVA